MRPLQKNLLAVCQDNNTRVREPLWIFIGNIIHIIRRLSSCGLFKINIATLCLKNPNNLTVDKKEIISFFVAVQKSLYKCNCIMFIGKMISVDNMPPSIGELLVDLNSCQFFRLQMVLNRFVVHCAVRFYMAILHHFPHFFFISAISMAD